MPPGDHTESTGFALAMLAIVGCSMGILLALFITMWRKARKRDEAVDDLLEEVEKLEQKRKVPEEDPPPPEEPWSRKPDWWKDRQ